MAKASLSPKSQVRPARDPAAPWAANAARQARHATGERAVVYCLIVEGIPLLKIGRTKHLKKRMASLSAHLGRPLHIGYWAEFSYDDAKDVERCALIRMRREFDSQGEWSLAEPMFGAAAIKGAADFIGVRPAFDGGAPLDVQPDEELVDVRRNEFAQKHRATGHLNRALYSQIHGGG